jgi:hypothetical protein
MLMNAYADPAAVPPAPDGESVQVFTVTVTPEIAQRWLAHNTSNRRIRPATVDRYSRDMLAENWLFEGSPIRFADTGALLDGQHRLAAVIRAGVAVRMLVIRGLAPTAQDAMDTGAKRTIGDQLKLHGYSSPDLVASVARFALRMVGKHDPTAAEIRAWLDLNTKAIGATDYYVRHLSSTVPMMPTAGVHALMACVAVGGQAGLDFFDGLSTRANLPKGSPILVLDSRLRRSRLSGHAGRIEQLALTYRAWNHWAVGKQTSILKITNGEGGQVVIPDLVRHPDLARGIPVVDAHTPTPSRP